MTRARRRRAWTPAVPPLSAGIAVGLCLISAYLVARVVTTLGWEYSAADALLAAALLGAEVFVSVQAVGYFSSLIKARRLARHRPDRLFAPHTCAPVAVLISAFNESADVLEETLAAATAMDYPDFTVYVLDDSTKPELAAGAARLAALYGARLVHRTNRAGYKAGAINDLLPALTEPYVALLDADQRPIHSWLREIVPLLEADARLAFVQTPQVCGNTAGLPVAAAAYRQQTIFYEHICEGKSWSNAMFCVGSNVVFRRSALLAVECRVGGRRHFFDETSVTEDFATSFRLHTHGWQSAYVNRTYCVGMSPETLPAYFTQQMRWAVGTVGFLKRIVGQCVRHPRSLTPSQWWEYGLSGVYYFIGPVNLVFMVASSAFLLFGVTPGHMDPRLYVLLFGPYFVFSASLFFLNMCARGHSFGSVWLGTALSFATFPVYIRATILGLAGHKPAFSVTPKAVGGGMPLPALWPQIGMFLLCAAAALAGLAQMSQAGPDITRAVTTWWASYHALLLGTLLFYFNRDVVIPARVPALRRAA